MKPRARALLRYQAKHRSRAEAPARVAGTAGRRPLAMCGVKLLPKRRHSAPWHGRCGGSQRALAGSGSPPCPPPPPAGQCQSCRCLQMGKRRGRKDLKDVHSGGAGMRQCTGQQRVGGANDGANSGAKASATAKFVLMACSAGNSISKAITGRHSPPGAAAACSGSMQGSAHDEAQQTKRPEGRQRNGGCRRCSRAAAATHRRRPWPC